MQSKEAYLERVVVAVEDLSARIAQLKARIVNQRVGVKLQYHGELEYVRNRFAEFKKRVEELEDANDGRIGDLQEATEIAWKDLTDAVDTLLAALP